MIPTNHPDFSALGTKPVWTCVERMELDLNLDQSMSLSLCFKEGTTAEQMEMIRQAAREAGFYVG